MAATNPFAKLAVTTKPKSVKKDRVTAKLSEETRKLVDEFVRNKAKITELISQNEGVEATILAEVQAQQFEMALDGGVFVKSMQVPGVETEQTYVTTDKWSVPQEEETLTAIEELIGKQRYNQFFTQQDTISFKKEIVTNNDQLRKIAEACEKAGMPIAEIFDVATKTVAVKGLDEKQFELGAEILPQFRGMVRQVKASLR
jgi:hypothetical protein